MKIFCGKLKLIILMVSVLFAINAFLTSPVHACCGKVPNIKTIAIHVQIYPSSAELNYIADRIFNEAKLKLTNAGFNIIKMDCDVYYIDLYIEANPETIKEHLMTFRTSADFKINKCWTDKSKPPPRGFINGFRSFWYMGLSDPKKGTINAISKEVEKMVQEFINDSQKEQQKAVER